MYDLTAVLLACGLVCDPRTLIFSHALYNVSTLRCDGSIDKCQDGSIEKCQDKSNNGRQTDPAPILSVGARQADIRMRPADYMHIIVGEVARSIAAISKQDGEQ